MGALDNLGRAVGNASNVEAGRKMGNVEPGTPADQPASVPSEAGDYEDHLYEIVEGDTLSEISDRFGVDFQLICEVNGIDNPDLIFAGQELRIPKA